MGENKFRAWNKIAVGWVYFHIPHDFFLDDLGRLDEEKYSNWCEYTGLKDKNGKEIYEGDLIKTIIRYREGRKFNEQIIICEIRFVDGAFWAQRINMLAQVEPLYKFKVNPVEVIGNTYENPELIASDKHV